MSTTHRAAAVILVTAIIGACTSGSDDATDVTSNTRNTSAPDGTRPTTSGSPVAPSLSTASTLRSSPPTTTDEPVSLGPLGSTDVTIETGDGRVEIGDAELPDSLPDIFPVPDDFDVQLATDVGDQSGFSGVTQLQLDVLDEFYRTELEALDYEVVEIQAIEGVVTVLAFSGVDGSGEVALSSAPGGGRSVLVTFSS